MTSPYWPMLILTSEAWWPHRTGPCWPRLMITSVAWWPNMTVHDGHLGECHVAYALGNKCNLVGTVPCWSWLWPMTVLCHSRLIPTSVRWSQHRIATRRHRLNETIVAWWPDRVVPCRPRFIPTYVARWPDRTVSCRPRLIPRSVAW